MVFHLSSPAHIFISSSPDVGRAEWKLDLRRLLPHDPGMNLSLVGKRALVCGSSAGIGRAAAVELALLGAEVTLLARNAEKLEQVRGSLDASKGQKHSFAVADFASVDSVREVARMLAAGS